MPDQNRSATNILRSLYMHKERISIFFDSIIIQSHINSESVFIAVSSIIYYKIFFIEDIFKFNF